jgi:SagB-type dehydrogenase family enzyme
VGVRRFLLALLGAFAIRAAAQQALPLPSPQLRGEVSLEEALERRATTRSFSRDPLELAEISQLLWAAGGRAADAVSSATRTYPSAGGIYPLELYLVAGKVRGLKEGIYRYLWKEHALLQVSAGDHRGELARAALLQLWIAGAPASVIITAQYPKTQSKYGTRGVQRYVPLDAGHAAQALHLQASALGLGSGTVGAFLDAQVKKLLRLDRDGEEPLLIIPVGRPARE